MEQKRQLRHHTNTCHARRDKMIDRTLTVSRDTLKEGYTEMDADSDAETKEALSQSQKEVTPQFVTFAPGLKEYLFAVTKTRQCMLLLLSGEENVSMVHGASHVLSAALQVDHRRLFCKLRDQPCHRSWYATTLLEESHHMINHHSHPPVQAH